MPIRPLDMQVMVPKLQNVAQMKHTENQRAGVNHSNMAATTNKQNTHNQQSVMQSHKDQEMDHQTDAKDEGKNKYAYKRPTGKKKEEKESLKEGSYNKIDIKV